MRVRNRLGVVVVSLLSFNAMAQDSAPVADDPKVTTSVVDSGTNGDIFMSSPAPYTSTGIFMRAKPSWPNIVAKTGGTDIWSGFIVVNDTDAELMRVTSSGNVGIGTNLPYEKLDLVGSMRIRGAATTASASGFTLSGTSAGGAEHKWTHFAGSSPGTYGILENGYEIYEYPRNSNPVFAAPRFRMKPYFGNGNAQFTIAGNGNVGIRRGGDLAGLEIAAPDATTNLPAEVTSYQGIMLTNNIDTTVVLRTLGGGVAQLATDYTGRALSFATGTFAEAMRIDPTGRVGIGTSNPGYKLEVAGDAHFAGTVTGDNIKAKYQDVAEWVPSREDLAPGTVVVLDTEANNRVHASLGAYDTKVAGVVSAQPGLSLGEEGEGKEQIATTGRVLVKVDATRAPIAVGDLLVTSEVAGVAMKSEPMEIRGRRFHQPGTIIGKALEPLAGGRGEILVLLSLQ